MPEETVSQGNTSSRQECQTHVSTLKPSILASVKVIGKMPSVKGWKCRLLTCLIYDTDWVPRVQVLNTNAHHLRMGRSIDFFFLFFFSHIYLPASGQAVVTGVVPSSPRFSPSIFIAHRVQQSHCSSIFHRVLLLPHALALSASVFYN